MSRPVFLLRFWVIAGLLIAHAKGRAQGAGDTPDSFAANFQADVGAAYWSASRTLDEQKDQLVQTTVLKGNVELPHHVSLKLEGWAYSTGNAQNSRTAARMRDAYVRWEDESNEVRFGSQVISWGRADRINPTDNLTARDYRAPFSADDEQRYGDVAFMFARNVDAATRFLLITKAFSPSVGPNDVQEQSLPLRRNDPSTYEYAVKVDHSGELFDWSVSYFNGQEKLRSLQTIRSGASLAGLSRGYDAVEALGADGVYSFGNWAVRGELAYLRFGSSPGSAGRQTHWFGVAGVENNLGDSGSLSFQYYFRAFESALPASRIPSEQAILARVNLANNQLHQYQHGISLRYAQRLWNDKLDYELVALSSLNERDFAFRPRLNWRYSDKVKFELGLDRFGGEDGGYFSSLEKNSTIFVGAHVIF